MADSSRILETIIGKDNLDLSSADNTMKKVQDIG